MSEYNPMTDTGIEPNECGECGGIAPDCLCRPASEGKVAGVVTQDLKALASKVTALEAALREAREVIERYADDSRWGCVNCEVNPCCITHDRQFWYKSDNGYDLAREYLDDNPEEEK